MVFKAIASDYYFMCVAAYSSQQFINSLKAEVMSYLFFFYFATEPTKFDYWYHSL